MSRTRNFNSNQTLSASIERKLFTPVASEKNGRQPTKKTETLNSARHTSRNNKSNLSNTIGAEKKSMSIGDANSILGTQAKGYLQGTSSSRNQQSLYKMFTTNT